MTAPAGPPPAGRPVDQPSEPPIGGRTGAPTGRRIGLLGGSFDPPHLAHRALGELARRHLQLDELRWLPAGAPWQKAARERAPGEHRVAMLRLLLADAPGHVIDPLEIERGGLTYTLDTVRELQAAGPADAQWFLIIGQDQYGRFDTWHGWTEIADRVTLAVAARDGQPVQPPAALAAHPHRLVRLPLPRLDISATEVRRRRAAGAGAAEIAPLVGDAVAGYIDQHHLYLAPSSSAPQSSMKG